MTTKIEKGDLVKRNSATCENTLTVRGLAEITLARQPVTIAILSDGSWEPLWELELVNKNRPAFSG
jgi:hypothetical protein